MSPEPVSTASSRTGPRRSAATLPLPVSSVSTGDVTAVSSMSPEPVSI